MQCHSVVIVDSFLDIPMQLWLEELGVKTQTDFFLTECLEILPIMLQYGYSHAVIGNEHSSNVGNLMWLAEGKIINHHCMMLNS